MTMHVRARSRRHHLDLELDCRLPTEGVTAIFGRSGCGKTSLLRIIAGLDRVADAEVHFGVQTWQSGPTFVPLEERRVGLVFQESSLLPHLGVRGNLLYGYQRTPRALRRHSPEEIYTLLGLDDLLDTDIGVLSGGQRQRVALGRALLASPQVLLLDEPLSALDSPSKREIMPFIERLAGQTGIPIFYVSHSADEIERLADHVALMDAGRVTAVNTLAGTLARADSPLFRDDGACSVLLGDLSPADEDHIAMFGENGARLLVLSPGRSGTCRLKIRARDVSLALDRPQRISILNCLRLRIESLHPSGTARTLVSGSLPDGQRLSAEISARSATELRLTAGMKVFALIKAVSLID